MNEKYRWFLLTHSVKGVMGVTQVWCRVLSFAKIYTTTCNYCWMFCEGFYLHQLITNTFEPPKSLTRLYLFGWRECALQ